MENHDIKQHSNCLKQFCRLCLGRLLTKKDKNTSSAILCSSKAADIQLLFGIDVTHDIPGVHPESLCLKCVSKMNYYKQKKSDAALKSAREMVVINQDPYMDYWNLSLTLLDSFMDTFRPTQFIFCEYVPWYFIDVFVFFLLFL